jgi:hypothetical protein
MSFQASSEILGVSRGTLHGMGLLFLMTFFGVSARPVEVFPGVNGPVICACLGASLP